LSFCRFEAVHAEAEQGVFPRQELFHRERIALAGFVEPDEAAVDGRDHFGLAPRYPAPRLRRRKILECQRIAVRSDDEAHSVARISSHMALPALRVSAAKALEEGKAFRGKRFAGVRVVNAKQKFRGQSVRDRKPAAQKQLEVSSG
jgi:hypothetical protein